MAEYPDPQDLWQGTARPHSTRPRTQPYGKMARLTEPRPRRRRADLGDVVWRIGLAIFALLVYVRGLETARHIKGPVASIFVWSGWVPLVMLFFGAAWTCWRFAKEG